MPPPPDARRAAYVIWGALLLGLLVFAAIASYLAPGFRSRGQPSPALLAQIALAFAFSAVLGSRVLPRLMRPSPGVAREQFALTRNIVALALCESAALVGLVAWILTGGEWALVAAAMGIAGVIACFPGDARWRSLLPGEPGRGGANGPTRMVR